MFTYFSRNFLSFNFEIKFKIKRNNTDLNDSHEKLFQLFQIVTKDCLFLVLHSGFIFFLKIKKREEYKRKVLEDYLISITNY